MKRLHQRALSAMLALAATTASCAAGSAYKLDTGDIVEIDVFGMPDFKRHTPVNIDGEIAIPYVGGLKAAGLSLAELRASITRHLVQAGAMRDPQVTVEIAEYRPFFISGDISHPGAIPYRKGLTVRVAVALAGGYDALRFRTENPLLLAPDLQSKHQALLIDLARAEIRIASLRAEVIGRNDFEVPGQSSDNTVVMAIMGAERRALNDRLQEWNKLQSFQKNKIEALRSHAIAMAASLKQQGESADFQAGAIVRTSANVAKGLMPINRIEEERRGLAMLKAQQTDVTTRLAATNAELANAAHDLEKLADERRDRLNQELEASVVEREKIAFDVQASAEKLLYTGAIKSQLRHSASMEVVIHRTVGGSPMSIKADDDAEIEPGDLVDIHIDPEKAAELAK